MNNNFFSSDDTADLPSKEGFFNRTVRFPLHIAVKHGRTDEVKRLLNESGTNINETDNHFHTPLWHAVANGKFDIVLLLMEQGANNQIRFIEYPETLTELAQLNIKDENLRQNIIDLIDGPPFIQDLHTAARVGCDTNVLRLLNEKYAVDALNEAGQTPLWTACYHGNLEVVSILLTRGANYSISDYEGTSPLQAASKGLKYCIIQQQLVENYLKNHPRFWHVKGLDEYNDLQRQMENYQQIKISMKSFIKAQSLKEKITQVTNNMDTWRYPRNNQTGPIQNKPSEAEPSKGSCLVM